MGPTLFAEDAMGPTLYSIQATTALQTIIGCVTDNCISKSRADDVLDVRRTNRVIGIGNMQLKVGVYRVVRDAKV